MNRNQSRTLLELARTAHLVPGDRKALGRSRLLARMAAGTLTTTASAAMGALSTSAASGAASGSLLSVRISAVLAGVVAGTLVMTPGSQPTSAPRSSEPRLESHAITTFTPPTAPVGNTGQVDRRRRLPAVSSAEVSMQPLIAAPSIEEERRILQSAQGALRRNLYDDALQMLAQHEKRFPRGRLTEEATALRVLVHCRRGKMVDAKRWADVFGEQYSRSPLVSRLKASCPAAFRESDGIVPNEEQRSE